MYLDHVHIQTLTRFTFAFLPIQHCFPFKNAIYHIKKLKKKTNYTIISDAEKALTKSNTLS